jgi:hypothetical protein
MAAGRFKSLPDLSDPRGGDTLTQPDTDRIAKVAYAFPKNRFRLYPSFEAFILHAERDNRSELAQLLALQHARYPTDTELT